MYKVLDSTVFVDSNWKLNLALWIWSKDFKRTSLSWAATEVIHLYVCVCM